MTRIAIVGGTGDLGRGLAARLVKRNEVAIGSRDKSRAEGAASNVSAITGNKVEAMTNEDATTWCEIAILAIPELPSDEVLRNLAPALSGKLVVSPIVPMTFKDGLFLPTMETGSAAERVESVLHSRVASAFHTVPAARLLQVKRTLDYDVLVAAETREVYTEAAAVVSSIEGLRPLYAGPLRISRLLETMTPALLNVGNFNKIRSPSMKVV